ncbi:MAG: phosphoglycerate dehydrogenase [Oscillospiraceae bacterium]|nr:phosphoglycerate dehydrogenase [Oscillospiraceae bacterium]
MKIVIIGDFPAAAKEQIKNHFPEDWEVKIILPHQAEEELQDADVLIPEHIRVNADLLEKAPRLKLVQTGAGYDNVNLEDCTRFGIQVCNASGVNANAVAEHVMAFILCWYKNILSLDSFLKARRDESELDYRGAELSEKTIGIVGLGHVGRKVAEYCNAFHMNVLGYSRKPVDLGGVLQTDLDRVFRESDIVSIHIPLNESTRHMINSDVFDKMKSDALLINTSRGAVVNQDQLVLALRQGRIGGACLDVFEEEPLSADHPLRDLNNVILTPHTAGLPDGVRYHKKRYDFFLRNINKVINGELPECRLNVV